MVTATARDEPGRNRLGRSRCLIVARLTSASSGHSHSRVNGESNE